MKFNHLITRIAMLLPAMGFGGVLLFRCVLWDQVPAHSRHSFYYALLFFAFFVPALFWLRRKGAISWLNAQKWFFPALWGFLFSSRLIVFLCFRHLTPMDDAVTYLRIASDIIRGRERSIALLGVTFWILIFLAAAVILLRRKRIISDKMCTSCKWTFLCLTAIIALSAILISNRILPGRDFRLFPPMIREEILSSYISVFPHFLGYPLMIVLTHIMGFGSFSLVTDAQLLNLFLSICIGVFLYYTARNTAGPNAGKLALLIWAVWPSQIFYTAIPLSEISYVFFLTSVLCLASFSVKYHGNKSKASIILLYTAVLCALSNFIRPLAVVLLGAIFLWFILSGTKQHNKKTHVLFTCGLTAGCLILYIGCATALHLLRENAIGREPAGFTMGWSMLDGNHEATLGRWNAEDAALFKPLYEQVQRGEITPDELHRTLFSIGLERIKERGLSNISFWGRKILDMWGRDEIALTYPVSMKPSLGIQNHVTLFNLLRGFCNGFYMAMLLLFTVALIRRFVRSFHKPERFSLVHIPLLFVLGMAAAHMILEQGQRYAFPAVVMISLVLGVILTDRDAVQTTAPDDAILTGSMTAPATGRRYSPTHPPSRQPGRLSYRAARPLHFPSSWPPAAAGSRPF